MLSGCASVPTPKFTRHRFPKEAYVGDVKRPYTSLGIVRSKVNFGTLDPNHEEEALCLNYYNGAAEELLKFARQKGGDAVIDIQSVVFYEDGSSAMFKTPECSDDGDEGQILLQGIAVKWKSEKP